MNDADSAPSPNRFCRKFGILKAAANASAGSDVCPRYFATSVARTNPDSRLTRMPAATRTADRPIDPDRPEADEDEAEGMSGEPPRPAARWRGHRGSVPWQRFIDSLPLGTFGVSL